MKKKYNEPTCRPRGIYGIEGLTMKSIDMYILHDRSVGGLLLEYIGIFYVKNETQGRDVYAVVSV